MRVAIIGKGGSGKSTISALISSYLASIEKNPLLIDADFNMHAGISLGIPKEKLIALKKIGEDGIVLREYFRGNNSKITHASEIIKTTPPGKGSHVVTMDFKNDYILKNYTLNHNGINLMITGDFREEDAGVNCFHKFTNIIEIFLGHLIDGDNDTIICDMTAGVDSIGSGLFCFFDICFMVVEPTLRSVSVFEQYKKYADMFDIQLLAIGNKVKSVDDEEFLKKEIGDSLISVISSSKNISLYDIGEMPEISFNTMSKEDKDSIIHISKCIFSKKRDWNKYRQRLFDLHKKNCLSWGNQKFGKDLMDQVDYSFFHEDFLS